MSVDGTVNGLLFGPCGVGQAGVNFNKAYGPAKTTLERGGVYTFQWCVNADHGGV